MSNKTQNNQKATKLGSYSAFLTLIVIAIVVVVNLMVGELPTTITKIDTSSLKLYTLTDTSIQIVKKLNEDVTMYYITQNGTEDANIEEMLNRYASYSSRITVRKIDPNAQPGFSQKYTDSSLSNNSVIVESAKRSTVVLYEEIYSTEYSEEDIYNYYYYGVTPKGTQYFNGEGKLTSAIDYVTSDDLPKLYVVTGHGETSLSSTVKDDAKAENILTEDISLLTTLVIPDDAGAVLLNAPTADLTADEVNVLRMYMAKGGKLMLITAYDSCTKANMPNLLGLAEEYGLTIEEGLMIEGNSGYYYTYPFYLLPRLNAEADVAQNLSSANITTILPYTHGIKKVADTGKYVEAVLTTSQDSYIKSLDYLGNLTGEEKDALEKKADDVSGSFYAAAYAEDTTTGGKLFWIGSPMMLDENLYSYNSELFMSSLTTLCEKTSSISILGKALQIQSLAVSAGSAYFWAAILILLLPIGCVVTGFVIWNKRRKK
ncbi:MAG: GldG family protein [Clostridia bacterium]|nr:GldG family protein [Clostridia bacterium]